MHDRETKETTRRWELRSKFLRPHSRSITIGRYEVAEWLAGIICKHIHVLTRPPCNPLTILEDGSKVHVTNPEVLMLGVINAVGRKRNQMIPMHAKMWFPLHIFHDSVSVNLGFGGDHHTFFTLGVTRTLSQSLVCAAAPPSVVPLGVPIAMWREQYKVEPATLSFSTTFHRERGRTKGEGVRQRWQVVQASLATMISQVL